MVISFQALKNPLEFLTIVIGFDIFLAFFDQDSSCKLDIQSIIYSSFYVLLAFGDDIIRVLTRLLVTVIFRTVDTVIFKFIIEVADGSLVLLEDLNKLISYLAVSGYPVFNYLFHHLKTELLQTSRHSFLGTSIQIQRVSFL